MPAAITSASLKTETGTLPNAPSRASVNIFRTLMPLNCTKFGESSITPSRTIPGRPTPTNEGFSGSSSVRTTSAIHCTTVSAGTPRKKSAPLESSSGRIRSVPTRAWSETTAAEIRSVTRMPTPIAIVSPRSNLAQLIQTIESRGFIAFGKCRIVKYRIDEVIHLALENQDSLSNMQQLGRALADDMNSEQLQSLAMEDQLKAARSVAPYLPARYLTVISHAHFVRDILFGKLLPGLSDK